MRQQLIGLIGLISLISLILPHSSYALPEIKPAFPRLANYFLHWTVSDEEARELAKFDLIILDAEVQERSRDKIALLRKLNPKTIILAYIPASEVRRDLSSLQTVAPLRFALGADLPEQFFLKDAAGFRRSFWPGTWIVNVADDARSAPTFFGTVRWNEYLPRFVATRILSTGLWDGVIYDNAWDDIVHFARGVPDLDSDGLADNPETAREKWQEGLKRIYRRTREIAPQSLVFVNDGPIYSEEVQGVLLENFPRKGWTRHTQELSVVLDEARDPAVPILNANTFNTGARDDFRAMRFGLATALLHDAHFSFDFGDQDHGQTWRYDEYDIFLGSPIGAARKLNIPESDGLWRRDFEEGIVFVNTSATPREITLPLEVEKIKGIQDPAVNSGAVTQLLEVGGSDGLLVFRPLQVIKDAAYENGVFARVFNARGEAIRTGFFAFDKSEPSGILIVQTDLDGDNLGDHVQVREGKATVRFADGRSVSFFPFGELWKGELKIEAADLNQDGVSELIFAQGIGGGQVRIFRPDGSLLSLPFFPFGPNYRGGVEIASGDLNADGFSEIIVGAGPGGGPQVRIFAGDGRLLSGGFFAYDPRFRGGVRVSVGDTDGDGRSEIITGSGSGGGPQVRIFDGKGQPLSPGFFAFDRARRDGVVPIVTDVDGDGKNEILAVTKEIL